MKLVHVYVSLQSYSNLEVGRGKSEQMKLCGAANVCHLDVSCTIDDIILGISR